VRRRHAGAGGLDQFFEFSISQIAKNHPRCLIRIPG
jgi:hypothetical protein